MTEFKERIPWVEAEVFGTLWDKKATAILKIEKLLDDYLVSETIDETNRYKKYIFPEHVEISVRMDSMIGDNYYADIFVSFPPKIKENL